MYSNLSLHLLASFCFAVRLYFAHVATVKLNLIHSSCKPLSNLLNELSLMSSGSPVSARFTVTPPNRSTLPVNALLPCTPCSWEQVTVQEKPRTAERQGRDRLPQSRPLTRGESLETKAQPAMLHLQQKQEFLM